MKIHVTDREGTEHVVEGQEGDALMIPLQGADLVDATCSGSCSCATCHVFVDAAFLSKLPEPESAEEEMLDFLVERMPESRLACQLKITPEIDNIKVTVAPEEGF